MSGIFSGALAAGFLAAVAMVASGMERSVATAAAEPSYDGRAFRLQIGGAASCVVEKGADARGGAAVDLHGCEKLSPEFAAVRFWQERGDGVVAFTREDGGVVVEFAVADGVAYQTFRPGAPLASLIALN